MGSIPTRRCRLNSASVIAWLTSRNSGVAWYLANASSQSAPLERRQRADDRLPLGDRQARVREARDAADDDHREHQRAADERASATSARCDAAPMPRRVAGRCGDSPGGGAIDASRASMARCDPCRRPRPAALDVRDDVDAARPSRTSASAGPCRRPRAAARDRPASRGSRAERRASRWRPAGMSTAATARICITSPSIVIECSSTARRRRRRDAQQAIGSGAAVADREVDAAGCARPAASRARTDARCAGCCSV